SQRHPLGIVVGGSLSEGLTVKLHPQSVLEDLAVGRYVVLRGQTGKTFFGMVTDIRLESLNPALAANPPAAEDEFSKQAFLGTMAYGTMHISPMLVLEEGSREVRPIKTIPAHFSRVDEATENEVNLVFGEEDPHHFHIGAPLEMEGVKVNLDLARLAERSSGVFGKSGTGKSFITRILLAGLIRSQIASCLIFDMHNDYGWAVHDEAGREFKGLRQLFDSRVVTFTLDPETSRHRGSKVDGRLEIGMDELEPEDIASISKLLPLNEIQIGSLYILHRKLGKKWISKLLREPIDPVLQELVQTNQIQQFVLSAIQRRFELFHRLSFIQEKPPDHDPVEEIFASLDQGISVVLEFGRHGNRLEAYMLVANYLTRRIHERYVDRKNKAAGGKAAEPKPLAIVIEEAHKFLDPALANITIFGSIAREMRKYNVTLLVVDQRPSAIDEEVMSQIGTRVTCLLDNEADVRAVLSGVSGAGGLREVLARLDTRQQALILGHAVPMPVVVRTRDYDTALYAELVGTARKPKGLYPE
ncbi:MAG: helicase HerA domain-containing protein, partial [Anaerolineales bacterium]